MKKPHYAWVVLGITFVCLLVTAAMRATPSVLIVPLEQEFGWSRATISMAISVNILLYGLMGPFAAGLVNRYGPRRVMAVSAVFYRTRHAGYRVPSANRLATVRAVGRAGRCWHAE